MLSINEYAVHQQCVSFAVPLQHADQQASRCSTEIAKDINHIAQAAADKRANRRLEACDTQQLIILRHRTDGVVAIQYTVYEGKRLVIWTKRIAQLARKRLPIASSGTFSMLDP